MSNVKQSFAINLKEGQTIAFATDLEGKFEYWKNFILNSKVVSRDSSGELELKRGCHFVHGGDVCDRGEGDMRILEDLITLKRKYPENVHFILGNRDVNKLRLPVALHETVLQYRPGAYWVGDNTVEADFALNDRVAKMKWVSYDTLFHIISNTIHRIISLFFSVDS